MSAPAAQTTIGFGNVLRTEWTKLRSVRSTYRTVLVTALGTIGITVLVCIQWRDNLISGKDTADGFDATLISINGIYLAQVAIGTLGVLAITSEYGTGVIRATMAAVPQRRAVLAAKGIVFTVCALAIGEVLSSTGFGIGQAILAPSHASVTIGSPGALRATIGGGLYLTVVGLLGFRLGALIRHTAGALSAFFGVLFATTAIVDLLPTSLRNDIIDYLPANSGSQILTTVPTHSALGPWSGLGVFCVYALVPIVVATVLIGRRDT